jgi:hypothetical protein
MAEIGERSFDYYKEIELQELAGSVSEPGYEPS